ncbi:FAD-binding protein, partial [Rhizocola hellebori]|uniref:FAD-binding protein n=1 Tax=Rhizocola hellebori TaxID=1392758 RepID=UPI0019431259
MPRWRNWAGTVTARPRRVHRPASEAKLASVVSGALRPLKVAGSGHSCGPIAAADGGGDLVLLDRLNRVLSFTDHEVTVQGGMRLHDLNDFLAGHGRALANMGSIAQQTVAGAISTGTHGTGLSVGALDQQVTGLRLVDAAGQILDTQGDLLAAARVSLGALGVISAVTLRHVPAFDLHATSHRSTLDTTLDHLDELLATPYFRFWWFPHTELTQTWQATPAPPATHRDGTSGGSSASARRWKGSLSTAAGRW